MQVSIQQTHIDEVLIVRSDIFQDDRGFFSEIYRKDQFTALNLPGDFVQLNHSRSMRSVLRGLHFQWDPPMGKLMRVIAGTAFLVAVDIRKRSPTLGKWFGMEVSEQNRVQVWAPAGFARGFCVLSDFAEIEYLCTGIYNSQAESAILWNDPEIGIAWPIHDPSLSTKDQKAQTLSSWLERNESNLFHYDSRVGGGV